VRPAAPARFVSHCRWHELDLTRNKYRMALSAWSRFLKVAVLGDVAVVRLSDAFLAGSYEPWLFAMARDLPGREIHLDCDGVTFCANVLELQPAVWRFVVSEGVGPRNNQAERVLRRGVLWRKGALGCSSAAGCRFVERLLTGVQTRRLQGRSVLRYRYDALVAHRGGLPAPLLLPAE
jgi:Transposase IS66 family